MKESGVIKTFHLFASCPQCVEDLLEDEVRCCGATEVKKTVAGVYFQGGLETAYKVCYTARIASRVLLRIHEFEFAGEKDLYKKALTVPWSDHFTVEQRFAVYCTIKHSVLKNQNYTALVVKDGIADFFRKKSGKRPSVDTASPDIRIHVHIQKNTASISLDISGESLHKRGYRVTGSPATLKENVAAALLMRAGWQELALQKETLKPALVDPMCGSGTILIEAAMIAARMPPGMFKKTFGFTSWKQHRPGVWEKIVEEGKSGIDKKNIGPIAGYDKNPRAVQAAQANIEQAGLSACIHVEKRDISNATPPDSPGCTSGLVAVNPPYGVRLGEKEELKGLYHTLGKTLIQHFRGWKAGVLSSDRELSYALGLRAGKTNYLYNGSIKCLLTCFELHEENVYHHYPGSKSRAAVDEALENRLKKNLKRLSKWARRNNITSYRLYDADLPEYAAAIDYFEGAYLHVQEYAPPPDIDASKTEQRLLNIVETVCKVVGIERDMVFLKQRKRQKGKQQYSRQNNTGQFYTMRENNLLFRVNFTDYLDPGIFLLSRNLRAMIFEHAKNKDFLNLFAYTGTGTVCAAVGGAASTLSVDTNQHYLQWAKENMSLNGLLPGKHRFVKEDCIGWLKKENRKFDFIFCDPPTFSNTKKEGRLFDLQKQHVQLIHLCMDHLRRDGVLLFSNNFKRFKLDSEGLSAYNIEDLRSSTLPEDFKRKPRMYNCWLIRFAK